MNDKKKKITSKQVVAMVGVILLVLLYLITLFAALFGSSACGQLFMTSMLATMFIPIVIWVYTWVFGKVTGRHTIADGPMEEHPEEKE